MKIFFVYLSTKSGSVPSEYNSTLDELLEYLKTNPNEPFLVIGKDSSSDLKVNWTILEQIEYFYSVTDTIYVSTYNLYDFRYVRNSSGSWTIQK